MGALGIQKCRSLCCWDCPPGHLTTPTDSTLSLFAESELLAPNETMDITVPTNCDKYFAKTSVSSAQESCLKTKFRPLFAQCMSHRYTPLSKGSAKCCTFSGIFERLWVCVFISVCSCSFWRAHRWIVRQSWRSNGCWRLDKKWKTGKSTTSYKHLYTSSCNSVIMCTTEE